MATVMWHGVLGMMLKGLAIGLIATLGLVTPAVSASLSLNSIDGVWQNASPSVSGEGTNQIRWGTPVYTTDGAFYSRLSYLRNNGQRSGYNFDASGNMVAVASRT